MDEPRFRPHPARLAADMQQLAAIGADSRGFTRLAYTQRERQSHAYVAERMRELGFAVTTDAVGNTIGRSPATPTAAGERLAAGSQPVGVAPLPAIVTGSHVDTVVQGGNFDGAVGTVGVLEAARLLQEAGVHLRHPLWLIVFAAEEGARFGEANLGAKAIAGELTPDDLVRLRDHQGVRLADAYREAGFDPDRAAEAQWDPATVGAFVELHIEQGGMLELTNNRIGIVDGIAGATRLRLNVRGVTSHSGATPMALRRDALLTAAEIALAVEAVVLSRPYTSLVATVGRVEARPGNLTAVAGDVEMLVDVRGVDADLRRAAVNQMLTRAREICGRRGTDVDVEVITDQYSAVMSVWLRAAIQRATERLALPYRVMPSGAGHDARVMNTIAPSAMIFVPSRAGLSHCPEEWTELADIAAGVQVLAESLVEIDAVLCQREQALAG